jgi:two-component sensor histidine kinase
LSTKTGQLEVNWVLAEDAGLPCVVITWAERGGPPVAVRAPSGFGTKLISRIGSYDLDGNAHLDFKPEGLTCTMRFPLSAQRNQLVSAEAS